MLPSFFQCKLQSIVLNNKDKKYDTELAAMENERNAIKTEIDPLKQKNLDSCRKMGFLQ